MQKITGLMVKLIIVSLLLNLCSISYGESTSPDMKEMITISSFTLEENNPSGLKAQVKLDNPYNELYKDLCLESQLFYMEESGSALLVKNDLKKFDLLPLENKNLSIQIDFQEKIPGGKYTYILKLKDKSYITMDLRNLSLDIQGTASNYLVTKGEVYFLRDGRKESNLSGPNYKPGETPLLVFNLKNLEYSDITAAANVTIYQRHPSFSPRPVYSNAKFATYDIKKETTAEIKINLPMFDNPESYYVLIQFYDENYNIISNIIEARYVISGKSGKILNSTFSKVSNNIKFSARLSGPADRTTELPSTINLNVFDFNKNLIESFSQELVLRSSPLDVSFELPISKASSSNINIIWRLEDSTTVFDTLEENINLGQLSKKTLSFEDIIGTQYEEAVDALVGRQIIMGYPDNTFKPENLITRAEVATIAVKALKNETGNIDSSPLVFGDVDKSHWAFSFIQKSFEINLIKGYPDKSFKPSGKIKYSEMLAMGFNSAFSMEEREQFLSKDLKWPYDIYSAVKACKVLDVSIVKSDKDLVKDATRGDCAKFWYSVIKYLKY